MVLAGGVGSQWQTLTLCRTPEKPTSQNHQEGTSAYMNLWIFPFQTLPMATKLMQWRIASPPKKKPAAASSTNAESFQIFLLEEAEI